MKTQQIIPLKSMKLSWNKLFRIVLVGVLISCSGNKYKEYYTTENADKIINHLETIGISRAELKDHVVLITRASVCNPCLREISWWDDNKESIPAKRLSLVVVGEYEMSSQAFLESQNLTVNNYKDNSRTFLSQSILPPLPLKLYFNEQGEFMNMAPIGTNGDIDSFVENILTM